MTIEDRLQRLEDVAEIADLRSRYCYYLDESRWAEFVDLFTADGTFEGLSKAKGHSELMHFFGTVSPTMAERGWHFCSNATVNLSGDRADGRIYMDYISVTHGVSYIAAGHYDDEFQRVDGKWKFAARKITFYFYSPLASGYTGEPPTPVHFANENNR